MKTLVLLHTAASHIATFDRLLADAPPDLVVRHIVAEPLLAEARADGLTPALRANVREAVRAAGAEADLVLCTCSTIGGLAEVAGSALGIRALRVDRPMAARAVQLGSPVLVVAALASTLGPTTALIHEEAARLGQTIAVRELLVADAWPRFEAGDLAGYAAVLAAAIRAAAADAAVIVLSQASMVGALPLLADLPAPVLASPALGAAAVLGLLT